MFWHMFETNPLNESPAIGPLSTFLDIIHNRHYDSA
jgi:hypothetical protein